MRGFFLLFPFIITMETKKDIAEYCNQILYYFNKMFENGGSYKEISNYKVKNSHSPFILIEFKYSNKMIIQFPVTKEEYNYWRSIKPKLKKGDKICQ